MLLLEGYISNFTCTRYYLLYVEFSDLYVNQSFAGQTLHVFIIDYLKILGKCCPNFSPKGYSFYRRTHLLTISWSNELDFELIYQSMLSREVASYRGVPELSLQ
jgi:hypothetical protein